MKTRKHLARTATISLIAVALGGAATAASAQDATSVVTADLNLLPGTRVLTTTTPTIALGDLGTGLGMDGTLQSVVTELAATGANPWSVTASAADFTSGTTTDTIPATGLTGTPAVPDTSAGPTPSGDITITNGSAGALNGVGITLFSVTGESTASVYSAVFTQDTDLNLAIPNGTESGVYTTTLTLTLVQ